MINNQIKKNKITVFVGWLLILMTPLLIYSCGSTGDSLESTSEDLGDAGSEEPPLTDSGSNQVSREQALAILAESDKYLNPIKTDDSQQNTLNKELSVPQVGASESPRNDGVHDNQNNAIATLQDPAIALADFPRDRRYQVDWVAALDQGLINPRADLLGKTKMQTLDLDIIMKNTQYMPWVKFPHIVHTKWLACSNCHPSIFIPKENANPISMNKVLRGQYCGVCHDKVAFALFICERCHSVPHAGSGKKWW